MKNNHKGYTRKELTAIINKYLLDCIPTNEYILANYNVVTLTERDRVNFVIADFVKDADYPYNKQIYPNNVDRFANWLQSLPCSINVDYYNYKILEIAKLWGAIPEQANEKQESKIIENWFNYISIKFFQLHSKLNK